ncbi:hypothetical protein [Myxococcus sp. RHSTA-1-4]|uniref:hypothetical protein n=1 Tax=Myxococcus sp. RHSTA-1-4 TaxID=2874601 RepID=UPI001CBC6CDB|nr:hypothetical protein [Myxococcus sp. RHSTA-1-4]MBZ4421503.1 hypothetical protein [Myxococcus sp. RHSTA-1-4]
MAGSPLAAVLFASSPALAGETRLAAYLPRVEAQPAATAECSDPRTDLFKAAEAAGVPINHEQTVTATAEGITFAGTSIAGFEQVPATRFPEGVDVGFIYLDAPETGIPTGFYRLNAHANREDVRLGTYPGTVGLISGDGKEVARVPATMDTFSMEVPEALPFPRTLMDARIAVQNPRDTLDRIIIIVIQCPNGTTIVIILH